MWFAWYRRCCRELVVWVCRPIWLFVEVFKKNQHWLVRRTFVRRQELHQPRRASASSRGVQYAFEFATSFKRRRMDRPCQGCYPLSVKRAFHGVKTVQTFVLWAVIELGAGARWLLLVWLGDDDDCHVLFTSLNDYA